MRTTYTAGGWFDYVEALVKGGASGVEDYAKRDDKKKEEDKKKEGGGAVSTAASAIKDALTTDVKKSAKAAAKAGSIEVFMWIAIGYLILKG